MAIKFEWDQRKAAANRRKHGLSFEVARDVFKDPNAIEGIDDRESYGEERSTIIGMVGNRLIMVAYTERSDGTIRIISARKATSHERDTYEG